MINEYGSALKWFFGVVEDRDDPKRLGRVRVRAYNYHTENKSDLPTKTLPWATIINSPLSAGINEVGFSPTGLMVGSTVFGFFADGEEKQMPMILGTIAGIPTPDTHEVSQLARGVNNVKKAPLYPEPDAKYASKYPYNKTMTTEGGHVIEIDDTPGKERIHVMHKSGTYIEIDNEGTRVDKTVGDHYSVIVGGENVRILGDAEIEVNGKSDITLTQDATVTCYGNLSGKVFGEATLYIEKDAKIIGDADISLQARQNISVFAAATLSLETLGNMTLRAGQINIETPNLVMALGASTETIVGAYTQTVGGAITMAAGLAATIAAGGAASITAGGSASITAGGSASMTAVGMASLNGGASAAITTAGPLTLTGMTINESPPTWRRI